MKMERPESGIIPVDGDYTHSVIKDNAILYNEVYEGADVQYTVLVPGIKEDMVLQQPTDREVYEYSCRFPGVSGRSKRQSGLYLSGREDNQRCEVSSGDAINGKMLPGKSVS